MHNSDTTQNADLPASKQLIRSTAIAIAAAGFLLIFAILPAEYGIDPTGVGKVLGLVKMGEIKSSLEEKNTKETVPSLAKKEEIEPSTPKVDVE